MTASIVYRDHLKTWGKCCRIFVCAPSVSYHFAYIYYNTRRIFNSTMYVLFCARTRPMSSMSVRAACTSVANRQQQCEDRISREVVSRETDSQRSCSVTSLSCDFCFASACCGGLYQRLVRPHNIVIGHAGERRAVLEFRVLLRRQAQGGGSSSSLVFIVFELFLNCEAY